MLDPKVAEALMSNVPEMQAFRAFISQQIAALDTLHDLDVFKDATELALEVKARRHAGLTLYKILSPLINTQSALPGVDPKEYVI